MPYQIYSPGCPLHALCSRWASGGQLACPRLVHGRGKAEAGNFLGNPACRGGGAAFAARDRGKLETRGAGKNFGRQNSQKARIHAGLRRLAAHKSSQKRTAAREKKLAALLADGAGAGRRPAKRLTVGKTWLASNLSGEAGKTAQEGQEAGAMVQAVRCGGDDALRAQTGGAWRIFGGDLSGRPRVLPLPAVFFPPTGSRKPQNARQGAKLARARGAVLRGGENAARAQMAGLRAPRVRGAAPGRAGDIAGNVDSQGRRGCAIMGGNVPFCPRNVHGLRAKKREKARSQGAAAQRSGRNAEKTPATPRAAGGIVGARASPSGGAMVQAYGQPASAAAKLREAGGA